ncbi:MAG: hypothetical protein K8J08_09230 [Thermoanaerobaculia bacterium]|nr:hypothetical protein [Thermoanaerobaculia bacterium]
MRDDLGTGTGMEQDELLRHLVDSLERLGIPYLVTGSVATIFYGEPRFTSDIDVVVQMGVEAIDGLVDVFPPADFYLSRESARSAVLRSGQFNVIHPRSGLKVDLMVAAMDDFDRSRFSRVRRVHPSADYSASFASPEDVILKKLEFYRDGGSDKHLRDSASVVAVTTDLDRQYIVEWAERLGVGDVWQRVLEAVDRTDGV